MKPLITVVRRMVLIASLGWIAHWAAPASAQTNEAICIVELRGKVEILPHGATNWVLTQTNQSLYPLDRVRTRANSSVGLLLSDQSVLRFGAMSEMEIPPNTGAADQGLHLLQGILSFFHRDKPGRIHVIASGGLAGIEGTEFVMAVGTTNGVEQTTLSVIDGKVRFSNDGVTLVLTNGEQAVGEPGQAPRRTPGFIAKNILQWCFYYPGVLDLNELPLTAGEQAMLGESLTAYRAGDLLAALAKYPDPRQPGSDAERVYHAALLLSVGQVEQAEANLSALTVTGLAEKNRRLATALRTLIAAVKREPNPSDRKPQLATELLAASFYAQSRAGPQALDHALELARRAVTNSPDFGFGWERVAELEFSFGRTDRALADLKQALRLSPRNAQALALKGFLLAARNQTREAIEQFDRALAVDSALGNAWLGRGLCRIRRGDTKAGREDLLVAAAMEPQRAALRSYLGKALGDAGDTRRATHELYLAKQLDPRDPTAWLYSALLNEQNNHINEAIRDLEKSQELNDNRSVYRSGLLLDQDRAVRSANLARIYQEAGMDDVALREASRAVASDYANYSAHLFLANSYDSMRDPNGVNLRYETPAESEYLVANLLAPVGAGILSPTLSQQEYSRLFERDRFGFASSTEYLSRGAWTQSEGQYGTLGNFSYDLEGFYRTDPGQRPNNDIDEQAYSFQIKQQLTPQDTIYLQGDYYNASGGDLVEYYNQTNANPSLRTQEKQDPILALGYHHEWQPGVHTLFLGSRLSDQFNVSNPFQQTFFVDRTPAGLDYVEPMTINQTYQSTLEIYSMELQQIFQQSDHNTLVGVRFQTGNFHTQNLETNPSLNVINFVSPSKVQDFTTDFERLSIYGYHYWQIADPLLLEGGVVYDWLSFPDNFRAAPISDNERTENQISPKAGFVWTPTRGTTVRAAYTRSLSGASFDQSYQLEPSQMAGFLQSYRSILPESVGGAEAGARFETYGVSLEQWFPTGTYLGLSGEILNSKVDRTFGVFVANLSGFANPGGTKEHLDFTERTLLFTLDQLLGQQWSMGMNFRVSNADLNDEFTEVPANLPPGSLIPPFQANQNPSATLDQLDLHLVYNHPSGFFAQFQSLWNSQSNYGYNPAIPGDDFWQFNLFAGYRSPRRMVELTLGILNLTGQDYSLNPLNLYNELPRNRTFVVRLRLNF